MKERFKGFDVSINPSKFLLILIDKGTLRERRKVRNLHYKDRERCYRRGKIDRPWDRFADLPIVRSGMARERSAFARNYSRISVFLANGETGIESKTIPNSVDSTRRDRKGEKRKKERKTPIKSSIKSIDDP